MHNHLRDRLCRFALLLLVAIAGAAQAADFTLREELNRQWTHECVTFPLTEAQLQKANANLPLLDNKGKEVIYQICGNKSRIQLHDTDVSIEAILHPDAVDAMPIIAFQTDLAPLETRLFTFANTGKASKATDLKVNVKEGVPGIELTNSRTGIRFLPIQGDRMPITGIRLPSGAWVGGSRLVYNPKSAGERAGSPTSVFEIQEGPVFSKITVKLSFDDKGAWRAIFRMFANEPVILVDEASAVDSPVTLQLMLSDNFAADSLFFRNGDSPYGKNLTWKIEKGLVFDWEPWLRWHASVRRGSTFSVFNDQSNDLLTVAAGWAGAWVDPKLPRAKQAGSTLKVVKDDAGVHVDLPLKHGQRKWMLGAFNKDECLAIMQDPKQATASPIPYKYLVKYEHFPLDMVKDYLLRWPSDLQHPRMILTPKDVARFRAGVTDLKPYQQTVQKYLANPAMLTTQNLTDALPAYLATQDQKMGELIAKESVNLFQSMVNHLLDEDGLPFGAAPHHMQSLATAPIMADIIYSSPQITPEQRERLRALCAFLGYTTARPDYWSPERGYSANPNMTTSVANYQAALAAFIPDHPAAKAWATLGLTELKSQLDTWSDDNGGWLEAPSYALLSYDSIISPLLMAYNAGFNDWLYTDPKVKTVIRWFAKTSTPPDSRIGGFRHRPPVGNTYLNEPNGEFGILAYLFREKDPQFSAEMQWNYKQNNMYIYSCVGGFLPAMAGYRTLLSDPNLPDATPKYGSELFPQTGVVLRDHYPSARETYLHMIHGNNHAHYDNDSGSIILYGKGRILADEFGYYGYIPQEDHSMVESPMAGSGVMQVRDFVTSEHFDYVAGVKEGWTRQIALVKGATPDAPCYYVMHDSLRAAGPATWRLWLTAQEVQVQGQRALSVGKEDVDLEIAFLTPDGVALTTESKERTSGSGMFPNWTWGPMKTTQIGLIAKPPHTGGFNVVLYPRLKTAPAPVCTPLAGGKAVKVTHEAGTDYVFMSTTPFTFKEGDIAFTGTVGAVQLRGALPVLWLGGGGTLTAKGKTLKSDKPLPQAATNLFPGGDFESGTIGIFLPESGGGVIKAEVLKGNPVAGDTSMKGQYCLKLAMPIKPERGMGYISAAGKLLYVDATKKYRMRMRAYTPDPVTVTIGGYASNGKGGNLLDAAGKVWAWSLSCKGPMTQWQTLETTMGPAGSGAALTWPEGMFATFMHLYIAGNSGTLYLDDITLEEIGGE
ncbi:MAG: hypothetical protein ACYC7E_16655 [Armatimonadota bacterium]